MNEFHKQAALCGLKKTLEGRYFDITMLKNAMKITGSQMSSKDEAALTMLHCVDWKDMPPELAQMVQLKIMEILNDQPVLTTELLSAALDGKHPSMSSRLLN